MDRPSREVQREGDGVTPDEVSAGKRDLEPGVQEKTAVWEKKAAGMEGNARGP